MSARYFTLVGASLRCAKCGMRAHEPDKFCDPRKKEAKR